MFKRIHQFLLPKEHSQGWTPYLWLIYLSFFFIDWFYRPTDLGFNLLAALTLTLFLILYFSAFRRQGVSALCHIIAILALGMAWAPFNTGASVLFIFAASFVYRVGSMRTGLKLLAAVVVLASLMAPLAPIPLIFWLPATIVSLIIGLANLFFAQNERKNAELRLSQAEVRRLARVAERERIARDLHDVLGHTLSLITVKSELAGRLIETEPGKAAAEIRSIEQTARTALAEVREAISGIHEITLDEALDQARLALQSVDVTLKNEVDPAIQLTQQSEAMLALVVREAVTNIIRHADARTCTIRLVQDQASSQHRLEIIDDGRGHIRPEGNGIQGMRARIESIHGQLSIAEHKNGGHLIAQIPAAVA
ncbi:MAG: sensor histidine kinase [Pseudomonadota bacterium]